MANTLHCLLWKRAATDSAHSKLHCTCILSMVALWTIHYFLISQKLFASQCWNHLSEPLAKSKVTMTLIKKCVQTELTKKENIFCRMHVSLSVKELSVLWKELMRTWILIVCLRWRRQRRPWFIKLTQKPCTCVITLVLRYVKLVNVLWNESINMTQAWDKEKT